MLVTMLMTESSVQHPLLQGLQRRSSLSLPLCLYFAIVDPLQIMNVSPAGESSEQMKCQDRHKEDHTRGIIGARSPMSSLFT